MIVVERVEGFDDLIRTYSDRGMMIRQDQTGAEYSEAIDVETMGYTYTETDTPIEDDISDSEALDILLGREGRDKDEQISGNETA